MSDRIAEVIEASTAEFTAQCDELHQPPPFGGLVRVGQGEIYAVVAEASTTSIEAGRRPIARGREAEAEEDVYRDNPQLEKLLRTDFRAMVAGHRDGERVRHYLPPRPARIHSFVYLCQPDEVAAFTQSLDFLSIIAAADEQADELIAACLRHAAPSHPDPRRFMVEAGRELAALLAWETNRLNAILRRIKG